jgi:two-component system sensor histidine kinase UhpB
MGGGVSRDDTLDRTREELIIELRALRDENTALKQTETLLRAVADGIGDPVYSALRRSEELLTDAQQLAHVGSWNLDYTSGTLTWSDEQYRIFGLRPGEVTITVERFSDLIHPEDRALVQTNCEEALRRGGDPYEVCYRARRADGTERIVQARAQVVFDDSGNPVRMFGSIQDITDQKLAEVSLSDEVKTSRESLAELSRRLLRAEEAERRRIAGELHDEIGQALTALRLNLQAMARNLGAPTTTGRLDESIALVEHTIEQVRGLSLDLRPALLDDLGLVPALRSYVAGLARRSNIEALFDADEQIDRPCPDVETACYRIAQEALTNVARHAGAKTVRVELVRVGRAIRLIVADDGVGFDVPSATQRAVGGASLGLLGMRERASLLGGQLEIASEPGRGTEVRATFPL